MTISLGARLAHVCLFAHDLEETRAFYARVLGINTLFNFLKDGRVIGFYLSAGPDTQIEVFEKGTARFDETNAINHFCLSVTNMDEAIAHIRGEGVAITDKSYGCDDTWQAWLADPNGVKIELFEYTPKSAQFVGGDRIATW